jgi:hypothetical protein
MPEVELLATGEEDYRLHAPDALRIGMRHRTRRDVVDVTTTAAAVARPEAPWSPPTRLALEPPPRPLAAARIRMERTAER